MKTRKVLALLLAMSMLLVLLTACGSSDTPSGSNDAPGNQSSGEVDSQVPEDEVITLIFGDSELPTQPEYEGQQWFCDQVYERTGGRVKIEYYDSNTLGNDREMILALQSGTLDIGKAAAGQFSEFSSMSNFFDLPGLFDDVEHFQTCLQDDEFRQYLIDWAYEETGLIPIMFDLDGGMRRALIYTGDTPITVPSDVPAGVRARTTGAELEIAFYDMIGMSSTTMTMSETYTGLQQGIVDCIYLNASATRSWAMDELCTYGTCVDLVPIVTMKFMSPACVEKLGGVGSELYNIVVECAMEKELRRTPEIIEEYSQSVYEESEEVSGITYIHLTDEERQQWVDLCEENLWPEYVGEGKLVPQEVVDMVDALRA